MIDFDLSIIIPVYNTPLISRAIDSIRKYVTKDNTEVIVIDGLSQDNTLKILQSNRDVIDILISERDFGPYDAANKGILKARGKWIFWLAADDELLINPADLLKYSIRADVICGSIIAEKRSGIHQIVPSHVNLKKLDYHCSLRHPATLFKKESLIATGLYNVYYKFAADRELFIRLRNSGARFRIVEIPVVKFHYGGLTTSTKVIESYKEDYEISVKYEANIFLAKCLYILRVVHYMLKNFIAIIKRGSGAKI